MRRLLRQFRRPVVILSVVYLAGVGLLAGVLPYQPAMIVPRGDVHQMLIGFSPDGRRLASSSPSAASADSAPLAPPSPARYDRAKHW